MKKRILFILMASTIAFAGCSKDDIEVDSGVVTTGGEAEQNNEETVDSPAEDAEESEDYTEKIKSEVAEAASSKSVQEEIDTIAALSKKYDELRMNSDTQTEMNENSQWEYLIWDEELNSLWSRMSDELDSTTKEKVLERQRVWVAKKDNAAEQLSAIYQEGSIYPMILNGEQANITRRRVYVLANEYAKFKGETFSMPARDNTGYFVDTQGTSDEYSTMTIAEGMEGDSLDITVSLHKIGELTGFGEATANGITFESYDGNVKATIGISYDGASFTVDAASDSIVEAGESCKFDIAF
jgi:uncharacterized protein YecT (DUF1311 family)